MAHWPGLFLCSKRDPSLGLFAQHPAGDLLRLIVLLDSFPLRRHQELRPRPAYPFITDTGDFLKRLLFIALALLSNLALADWIPVTTYRGNTVVIQAGGGKYSYSEPSTPTSAARTVGDRLIVVPSRLKYALNTVVAQQVANRGASFMGGTVTGLPTVTLRPDASGAVFFTLSGLGYQATSKYSGRKYGISFSCTNTMALNNLSVTAQYGALDGIMQDDKLGISADPTSQTDCDTNLSWILPFAADYIVGKLTDKIDSSILANIKGSIGSVKDVLFYERDSNYLVGLNKLIPASATITRPDGTTFPIGQYVQNNLSYLLANSQVTMKIGRGANPPEIVYGQTFPSTSSFTDTVLDLQMATPVGTISLTMTELVTVQWQWQSTCLAEDPHLICYEP